jgi:hypothetical protein
MGAFSMEAAFEMLCIERRSILHELNICFQAAPGHVGHNRTRATGCSRMRSSGSSAPARPGAILPKVLAIGRTLINDFPDGPKAAFGTASRTSPPRIGELLPVDRRAALTRSLHISCLKGAVAAAGDQTGRGTDLRAASASSRAKTMSGSTNPSRSAWRFRSSASWPGSRIGFEGSTLACERHASASQLV